MSHLRSVVVSAAVLALAIASDRIDFSFRGVRPEVALAQAPAPSQAPTPPSQTPVFQGGVNFVSVDAYPRRAGRVVEGLTKADFQILEDGKPQAVDTFEFVHIAPNPVDSDRRDPTSVADSERQAADPHNRLFVVFLDMAHTGITGSYSTRRPVVEFLDRTIGATDLFALMTAETPMQQITFGRRTESIDSQLANAWTWGQMDRVVTPHNAYEDRLNTCAMNKGLGLDGQRYWVGLGRDDELQTSLENLMTRLRDLRDARKNILFISEGWVPRQPRPMSSAGSAVPSGIPGAPIGTTGFGAASRPPTQDSADRWCDSEFARLESIDFERHFRDLLAAANRANVSFYPIDVGGLKTSAVGDASSASLEQAMARDVANGRSMDTLRELAENTDGFAVVNTNDISSGVKRVSDDLSSYYLLGYSSTNTARDGKYHRIEVKMKTPGVSVSARKGYYAPGAAMMVAAPAVEVPVLVSDEVSRLSRLRPNAEAFVYGAPTATGLDVTVELASGPIAAGRWKQGADVRVVVTAPDGVSANTTSRVAAGTRSVVVALPFDRARRGPWSVTAVVTGDGERVQDQLDVPVPDAAIVGMPMAWRATPSPRSPLLPMADFQLRRNERLHIEWPIVQEPVTKAAKLLDRKGQPLVADLPLAVPPPDRHVLALDLPMSSLPEGDFLVDWTVAGANGVSERRVLGFRVVR